MKNLKAILIPTVSLFVICFVTTFLLALTNAVTAERIEELQIETARQTRQEVLSSASAFDEAELDGNTYYVGKDSSGAIVGYVFQTVRSGYGGPVTVMSAFDTTGTVTGIKVIDCSETAGLGLNAQQQWFADRYKGTDGELSVIKNGDASGNEILAITGATITTSAVTDAVNDARAMFEEITGGEQQ